MENIRNQCQKIKRYIIYYILKSSERLVGQFSISFVSGSLFSIKKMTTSSNQIMASQFIMPEPPPLLPHSPSSNPKVVQSQFNSEVFQIVRNRRSREKSFINQNQPNIATRIHCCLTKMVIESQELTITITIQVKALGMH